MRPGRITNIAEVIIAANGAVIIVKMMMFTIREPVMTEDAQIRPVMIIFIPRKRKLKNAAVVAGPMNIDV